MTVDEVLSPVRGADPGDLPPLLRALRLDAQGDWQGAHAIVQDDESADAAWIHAYLHRKEADASNAAYWYRRAGQAAGPGDLEEERRRIAGALLSRASAAR